MPEDDHDELNQNPNIWKALVEDFDDEDRDEEEGEEDDDSSP